VHPGMTGQPDADRRMLVGGVVVDHHVQLAAGIGGGDLAEEGAELLVAVSLGAGVGDPPGGHLQRREQRGGAVPEVVEGQPLRRSGPGRQGRRGALEGLQLRLLVHAQHHRRRRRVQVQADDVVNLALQLRVGGELEGLGPPGLHAEAVPHPGDGGVRDRRPFRGQRGGQQPRRPVRRAVGGGRLGQGPLQHPVAQGIRQRRG
jgi:hypothetical protein